MKKYVIFGVSNYLSDIFDLIHANNGRVVEIFQNVQPVERERDVPLQKRIGLLGYGITIHDSLEGFRPEADKAYTIGFTSVKKKNLITELKNDHGIEFASLIHPKAHLGSNVEVSEGVMVSPGAVIAPNAALKDFCVVNRAASIGHDTVVGRYSKIGPSAAVGGLSRIGDETVIGMNASVLERTYVGSRVVIGAGSVVNRDVPDGVVAYGVPAKIARENTGE